MYIENRLSGNTPEEWAVCQGLLAREQVFDPAERRRFAAMRHRDRVWQEMRRRIKAGETLLDAGCGMGQWVRFCCEQGIKAAGLDYSPAMVAVLRERFPQACWVEGRIQEIPVSDNSFDHVISWGVVEHDPAGPMKALREFYRVLKKSGYAFVTTPLDSSMTRRSSEIQFREGDSFFQFFFTRDELEARMIDAGFTVEKTMLIHRNYAVAFPKVYMFAGKRATILGKIIRGAFTLLTCFREDSYGMILVIGKKTC